MSKLTQKQLKEMRDAAKVCDLCGTAFTPKNPPVVDHDHKTGVVRGVLHRGCNAALGHVENNGPRYFLADPVKLAKWARNLVHYLTRDYSHAPLYPTHRTEEQKRALRNKRVRAARTAKLNGGLD